MSVVRNEQRRYLATAANNLGVASIVTGGIAPIAGALTGAWQMDDPWRLASACLIWLVIGVSCIIGARRIPEELE